MEAEISGGCKAKAGWGCEHTGRWSHRGEAGRSGLGQDSSQRQLQILWINT